jgi:group II intron reverse transcriptase/maturase
MMDEHGKSDRPIVPTKRPNKDAGAGRGGHGEPYPGTKAETPDTAKGEPTGQGGRSQATAAGVEGRGLAKGNPSQQNGSRPPSRPSLRSALERIRRVAKEDKGYRFTTLFHHIANVDALREAYYRLNRRAAPGVDGVTWQQYGEDLEANLSDLCARLKRGAYRAKPVRRTYIPKTDGRQRPLGVTTLEDKLVQLAVVRVLNAIYEADFLGFSYGFRPGRGPHNALDALAVVLAKRQVNWLLDADLRAFFDTIVPGWLVKFVEHRIADRRVVRLIQKWLNAGVLEDGKRIEVEMGTPQGGSISPLLANIYLHYVFDLWAHQWRQRHATGDVVIVRYADDFVVGFQHKADAERMLAELRERFAQFGLALHPDKTRLIEFGRYAAERREARGLGKPETFDFLGFTHICGKTRKGWFQVRRQTMRKRLRAKLKEVKTELDRRLHQPYQVVGLWLGAVLRGHLQYYAVPLNYRSLASFRGAVMRHWKRWFSRRSQKGDVTWARLSAIAAVCLPPIRILHPYPDQRFGVRTQGGSPVR